MSARDSNRPDLWLTEAPPELIREGDLLLARPRAGDLADLMAAINASHEEIHQWLGWARERATESSVDAYLEMADRGWAERSSFAYVVREVGADTGIGEPSGVVGGCGLHGRLGPGALEIGYWVRTDRTRRGIATAVARALTRSALELPGVDRVRIHCDQSNLASAGVPAKLGYRLDRIEPKNPPAPLAPAETGQLMIWVRDRGT